MNDYDLADLAEESIRRGGAYHEFLREPTMSCGLYRIPKGGRDRQSPHTEDEIYYIVRGRAKIRIGVEHRAVQPGSIIFVPARAEHRFQNITTALIALVFFAPPEGSQRKRRK